MALPNNLYPPVVDSWAPAFKYNAPCRINFSPSIYNSLSEIKNVQISIVNQKDSRTAFRTTPVLLSDDSSLPYYPSGIKISSVMSDDDGYYVIIDPGDLKSGQFELNQIYKVQLRFTSVECTENPPNAVLDENGHMTYGEGNGYASWLEKNKGYFSEWSTVCLVKGISTPKVTLLNFVESTGNKISQTNFSTDTISFVGNLSFDNANEQEYLKYYQIKIFDTERQLFDSGILYPPVQSYNEFNYVLPLILNAGIRYQAELTYTTINNYSETLLYNFTATPINIGALDARLNIVPEQEYGCIKVGVVGETSFLGNLAIRRTSSKSNFELWEDVKIEVVASPRQLDYEWRDYTIESGVFYKYGVQRINAKGYRSKLITESPNLPGYMMVFDDIFLTRKDMQIAIRYNAVLDSFKHQLIESKTDTIGAKYPFIRRNADVNYRTFSLSGLITAFMDYDDIYRSESGTYVNPYHDSTSDSVFAHVEGETKYKEKTPRGRFLNKENIYGDRRLDYEDFNSDHNITNYNDIIYERDFRKKVLEFLHANNVKLFRSAQEGNMLVKLMDISLSPDQTLGRMLYTFSATVYEIDECSIENFDKYGIEYRGEWDPHVTYDYLRLGQYAGPLKATTKEKPTDPSSKDIPVDLIKLIQDKIDKETVAEYRNEVQCLTWFRIQFESPPYLITTDLGTKQLRKIPDTSQVTSSDLERVMLGYILIINGVQVLVSPRGFYELADAPTKVESVRTPVDVDVSIDYLVAISEQEYVHLPDVLTYYKGPGQIWGTFENKRTLSKDIYLKYKVDNDRYYKQLLAIDKLTIEAPRGTVIYLTDSYDYGIFRHEVGRTGILEFYDEDAVIMEFYFDGIHLDRLPENYDLDEVRDYFYTDENEEFESLNAIKTPEHNHVYTIGENKYIYYNEEFVEWDPVTETVRCPIPAVIDYIYESAEGTFNDE